MKRRPSAALVVAMIALVAAIGGVAAAAPSPRAHSASLRGKRGPRGRRGPRGPQGPAGSFSGVTVVDGPSATMGVDITDTVGDSQAVCPAGSVVVSGGWDGEASPPVDATVGYDRPYGSGTWGVIMANNASIPATFHAVAVCARGAGGLARDVRSDRLTRARFAKDVAIARTHAK